MIGKTQSVFQSRKNSEQDFRVILSSYRLLNVAQPGAGGGICLPLLCSDFDVPNFFRWY
jgi:hypothetical protein